MSDESDKSPSHPTRADVRAIVLAAGKSTRMKSAVPKVLHPLRGRPLIDYCLNAAASATQARPIVVVGSDFDAARDAIGTRVELRVEFAVQAEQLGTGHAVLQAESLAPDTAQIVVSYGDMPLLRAETLRALIAKREKTNAAIAMLTVLADNPRGFGRVSRDAQGRVMAVLEEVDCPPEQLAIRELNVGVYCFDGAWVWDALRRIRPNARKGEYFLTDLVEIAINDGREVHAIQTEDIDECIGINTRVDLADADAALRRRINHAHMLNGVTILDPATTYIDPTVVIGADTTILPNTHLLGNTYIGANCIIGPDSLLANTAVGNHVTIRQSVIEDSQVDDYAQVGPFSHFRPGAHVHEGAHVGNFAEIKNSTLGAGSHMGHFSYLGDATVGEHVNIGAGTITCNYDGVKKNRTIIGDGAFIGSDTMLVAPVTVGQHAATGAGSVVTKDVPDDTLAVGAPARAIRKLSG